MLLLSYETGKNKSYIYEQTQLEGIVDNFSYWAYYAEYPFLNIFDKPIMLFDSSPYPSLPVGQSQFW
jgi:hypothetical protein